ncbi:thioredoxin domain-containing protein [Niabella terrae]
MSNALIHESSPYLLQHAHNPVNWYPWGPEALQLAIEQDKPILVSIGYAACHWCHVMERESFEDEATAEIMNAHFINIKIDREERPDIDHIYMDAVQTMTGGGGWPLNVFLTPGKKPFYGGTYFPPRPVMNRPSWKDVLTAVADAFSNKREDVEQQARGLTEHLFSSNQFGINPKSADLVNADQIDQACEQLLQQADLQWGGFGAAPKFPQTFSIQFLLNYYWLEKTKSPENAERALKQARLSLDKMIQGGIYDQLGGGFARYSTDKEWLAPHFEKMLYDNALLVNVLAQAYQITQEAHYRRALEETIDFVRRELLHPDQGFYAALDADSEGIEGRFYVWQIEEIRSLLGVDAEMFIAYYGVTETGNWPEGTVGGTPVNILHVAMDPVVLAAQYQCSRSELENKLAACRQILMKAREDRVRPALDDKILLSWNAMMNTALSKAFEATGATSYKELAVANMAFLLDKFQNPSKGLQHVWKDNTAKYPAFLDDYACLIQSLLALHRISADITYLNQAHDYCEQTILSFSATDDYFYFTPENQQDVIVRKIEVYDGATPSGNALMAQNLRTLGILFDNPQWLDRAYKMTVGMATMATKYPVSFGCWLDNFYAVTKGSLEIVLIGNFNPALTRLLAQPLPFSVVMSASTADPAFPLLRDKSAPEGFRAFLCRQYDCQQPVQDVDALLLQIHDSR